MKRGHHTGILTQPITVVAQKVHSCQQQDCRPAAARPGEGSLQLCLHSPTSVCTEARAGHLGKRPGGSVRTERSDQGRKVGGVKKCRPSFLSSLSGSLGMYNPETPLS